MKPKNPSLPIAYPDFDAPDEEESDGPPVTFVETLFIGPPGPEPEPSAEEFFPEEKKEKSDTKKGANKKIIIAPYLKGTKQKVDNLMLTVNKKTGEMTPVPLSKKKSKLKRPKQ